MPVPDVEIVPVEQQQREVETLEKNFGMIQRGLLDLIERFRTIRTQPLGFRKEIPLDETD